MSSSKPALTSATPPPPDFQPRIPERYIEVPDQRRYILSLGVACQAIKIFDLIRYWFLSSDGPQSYARKWMFVDFLFCVTLSWLRIPRLRYGAAVVALQIISLWIFNGVAFGGLSVNVGGGPWAGAARSSGGSAIWDYLPGFGSTGGKDAHLLGQHTVRMSPISTAQLNPYSETFCLPSTTSHVLIPVLLNNTSPASVRYTLTPLAYSASSKSSGKIEYFDLSSKDLRAIEQSRVDHLQLVRAAAKKEVEEFDEYDDEDEDDATRSAHGSLQKTQHLTYIRLNKAGTLRLDRVVDQSNVDARLVFPNEITVVPCPSVAFTLTSETLVKDIRCATPGLVGGAGEELQLEIDITGVPPLSLRWHRDVDYRREPFMVEGIEGPEHEEVSQGERRMAGDGHRAPVQVRVPLTVVLDSLGEHSYVLESITDGLGNLAHAGFPAPMRAGVSARQVPEEQMHTLATTRSVSVLRRPSVSFKSCGPGKPASLLIGSEAQIPVSVVNADSEDEPWEVAVRYDPPLGDDGKPSKRYKAWTKALKTQENKRDLTLRATAPGEYTITGVKGQHCEGDVLSPDTCRVVERPQPSAEIEWKKIHECSGDIGVAASLILHGTPPFQVYYQSQRDSEAPRDSAKTFPTSRGELTVQPDRSGHYTFKIYQISDANYKRIDLKGSSIELDVHPPPSADFSGTPHGNRGKKSISSCSGSNVDVDVDLRGTPPWNIEVQIVGPKGSETMTFRDITTAKQKLSVPIPKAIDRDGGSFEVELLSVEDAYKCKRSLSVPGIAVNVRRVLPTVKFYGKPTMLPLRLTGEAPWQVRYREQRPHQEITFSLNTLQVSDSQCPGTVVQGDETYVVDHVPRPSAKLSSDVEAAYESFNGVSDHVDLDLTGRPPFQIMYNIAEDNGFSATKLLDQPTFSSIQPRTRFQLRTSEPSRIYYEVKQIGDAAYPLAKNRDAIIPRSGRLLFEQQVLMRPSARFKSNNRLTFCLNDALSATDAPNGDGVVVLEGTPPFQLTISIRNLAASNYSFNSVGPHQITLDSVRDAPRTRAVWADVAETAAIVPFSRREDYCVGDSIPFQLEGTPPWSVGLRVNGRVQTADAPRSPWSAALTTPGEFAVTSVAHRTKRCRTAVADLRYQVHALPAAQVGHGKRIVQDIHEGDQAEILFTLVGEPPFTFTYQRAELTPRKGAQGKVLETHTVSGVTTKEYSIFSAMEGTWTITSISDRYCRYPPVQQEDADKVR
ncbi:uncharacterized protein BXZ73DRAFT_91987 [Epithele typhae]|uniref:uncharacterized protein n=1 Tax=Epithele typhae TaxID=378194 RepID=UPI00200853D0|nr:uncharacterized protein BXZ73DRAFT_91987 [Epithele typhae]KAH9920261.1 hypothetical protein BXZ73DRAFT_91987 [Epithele typhae]